MCTETTDTATTQPVARSELDEATFRGNLKQMEKLLKAGCPVDVSSPPDEANVWTPLHTAARRGDLHAVKLLVENGANIEETWDGYTAEDLARLREHTEVSDYLKKLRKQQKKEVEKVLEEQLTKLLGQTVTVVLDGDEEKTPNEFQIQSLILPEITQNISDMLQVKVTCLKSRDSQISIRQTRDLLFARDLIAYVTERNRDSTQVPSPSPERLDTVSPSRSQDGDQRKVIFVQHFDSYWSRPLEEFEFGVSDDYDAILEGVSRRLGQRVDALYTCDKLSKIKQTGVLVTKHRVIAAAENTNIRDELGSLGDIRSADIVTDRQTGLERIQYTFIEKNSAVIILQAR
jgi:hypothetical protein